MSTIFAPLKSPYMGGNWKQDQGVDINGGTSAIANKPLHAIQSGTVVGHGISGFGQWAPILKLDTPIGGQDYVYYGHAGPGLSVPVGTHVNGGDICLGVGAGIGGMSSGPHLEIGFSDARGTPVNGTSGAMMQLLKTGAADPSGLWPSVPGSHPLGLDLSKLNPYEAVKKALSDLFDSIVQHAKYAAVLVAVLIGGFVLLGKGISRTTHEGTPA